MRTLVSLLLAGCLGLVLVGPARAGADEVTAGFNRITFDADCTAVPGHMQLREVRTDRDHMRVQVQATGLPITGRRWYGDVYMQPGEYGLAQTFTRRAADGEARHTSTWDVPIASTPVRASLMDMEGEGQPECDLYVSHTKTSAAVESGSAHLMAAAWEGDLQIDFSNYQCDPGTAWKARIVATWRDHRVRKALHPEKCRRDGFVGMRRSLAGERLPRALSLVARDDAGHVWRASYRIGR